MPLLINIIGAGNLGATIGHLLAKQSTLVSIGGILNRSDTNTLRAIKFIGSGVGYTRIEDLPSADITLITTPDDAIINTAIELAKNSRLKTGSIVIHCSGSLSSDALKEVSKKGCFVASVHPMRSFAHPALSIEQFSGTYCALEGDQKALPTLKQLFEQIGSITFEINKEQKPLYHAAGVFCSNYLITLAHLACDCFIEAGLQKDTAIKIITNLMKGSLTNLIKTSSLEQALTGPIQRGDISTIKNHMNAFAFIEQKELYALLGKATLSLTHHNSDLKERIIKALE